MEASSITVASSFSSEASDEGLAGGVSPAAIDVNLASAIELQRLPGIGPKKAEAIVEYRLVHGGFGTMEELLGVSGIGPSTLERIEAYITLGDSAATKSHGEPPELADPEPEAPRRFERR